MSAQIYMCHRIAAYNDSDVDEQFKQDNPHFSNYSNMLYGGTPYIFRDDPEKEPELQIQRDMQTLLSMSDNERRNIAFMNAQLGSGVMVGLATLFERDLLPASKRIGTWAKNEKNGLLGAGISLLDVRDSQLQRHLGRYEKTLGQIRQGHRTHLPKFEMVQLEQKAKAQHKKLNLVFRQELNRLSNASVSKRGTALTNAQRGINQAKSSRTSAPIQVSTSADFHRIKNLSTGLSYTGRGLIALDAANRVNKVANDYKAGKDWQRTAVVQGSGLAVGTVAGSATAAIISNLTIGLAVTPVGWVIAIGVGVVGTYYISTKFDGIAQDYASSWYDR